MKRAGRHLVCLSLAAVCAVAASGCGNDDGNEVPADAVAKVGDTVITKEQFDQAYASAAKAEAQQGGLAAVPDPPRYKKCVASLNKAVARMEHRPQVYELEASCKQRYEQLKTQAMQSLIQSQWFLQEAEDRDLTVTDAEVQQAFEEQKASFPKEKDYRKFVASLGASEEDMRSRAKLYLLQSKLTAAIQKDQEDAAGDDAVGEDDIEEYYEENHQENKEAFYKAASRDLSFVITKTKAEAEAAKKELEGGASFKSVAKEYSIDAAADAFSEERSKLWPGTFRGVSKTYQALDRAVFGAEVGEIEGPVKTDQLPGVVVPGRVGWYVFRVEKHKPAERLPLEEVKEWIRGKLASDSSLEAQQDFLADFREEHKNETRCADGFIVDMCSNAPKVRTNTGPAPGGAQPAPGASAPPAAPGAPAAPAAPAQPAP
jgi:foldase protein PrsA